VAPLLARRRLEHDPLVLQAIDAALAEGSTRGNA